MATEAMEVEEEASQSPKNFSLDILDTVKSSQLQHGLRHSDYGRYRQYCCRRLRRIRKSLKFMHGRGRYLKKVLEADQVKDVRHLLIPLINAERAWSYAMAIKRDNSAGEPRPRFHLLARLSKAAKWSEKLEQLCAETADSRTALEAEAYSAFMCGNMLLEREDCGSALQKLEKARTIYQQMSRVGDVEQSTLCNDMVEEIDPSIRYCKYRMGEEDSAAGGDLVEALKDEGLSDLLRAKLEAVQEEGRKKQAEQMNEIEWRGQRLPVRNEKLRITIIQADDIKREVESTPQAERMGVFDKLFVAYNDALDIIRGELRTFNSTANKSAKSGIQEQNLQMLQSYISLQKMQQTIQRNKLLLLELQAKLHAMEKGTSADDLVRLYDTSLQNLHEMAELPGSGEDDQLSAYIDAEVAAAKVQRCFYLAKAYAAASKWPEAQALFGRAQEQLPEAMETVANCASVAKQETPQLQQLLDMIVAHQCRARASAFLETYSTQQEIEPKMQLVSLDKSKVTGAPGLLSNLGDMAAGVAAVSSGKLVEFPPPFEAVPCKPMLFDLAANDITFPDLATRAKENMGSGLLGWFRR